MKCEWLDLFSFEFELVGNNNSNSYCDVNGSSEHIFCSKLIVCLCVKEIKEKREIGSENNFLKQTI